MNNSKVLLERLKDYIANTPVLKLQKSQFYLQRNMENKQPSSQYKENCDAFKSCKTG
jgi:hypothetical protein